MRCDTWDTFAGQKFGAKNGGSTILVTPPVIKLDKQEEPNVLMRKIEYLDIISEEVQYSPTDF